MLTYKISLYVRSMTEKYSIKDNAINFSIVPGFDISLKEPIHDICYQSGKST